VSAKKKLRSFTAGFALRAWVEIEIRAENYDAALAKAREMKDMSNFVTEDAGVWSQRCLRGPHRRD